MGVLLYICCIFSEHLFLGTPLSDCFSYITITWPGADAATGNADEINKQITFKSCATFTDCISDINITQTDNAKSFDVMILIYDLIEYNDN